jgi:transcriptional regulator with XRE-family HTH domain
MSTPPEHYATAAIGQRLLLTRQALGIGGQGDFAARAGIGATAYNQYETGRKRPSIENAIALCDAYDLTLDWIYRGDPSGLTYELGDAIKALRAVRSRSV